MATQANSTFIYWHGKQNNPLNGKYGLEKIKPWPMWDKWTLGEMSNIVNMIYWKVYILCPGETPSNLMRRAALDIMRRRKGFSH